MIMGLEEIARQFAQQRKITLGRYGSEIKGHSYPFGVRHSIQRKKESFFVMKNLPPSTIIESEILVTTTSGSNEGILTINIVNGCLKDYLALLQGTQDNLSRVLHRTLSNYLNQEYDPLTVISEKYIGVNFSDITNLLPRFYPVPSTKLI